MEIDRLAFVLTMLVISGATYASQVLDSDSWQIQRLFHPTAAELTSEVNGSIMIYDGLTDKIAARALDEQFDRIGAMMFTRTVVTDETDAPIRDQETGEYITEEDGCD